MAKCGDFWDDELCAEHDGTLPSFRNADAKLTDISNYTEIFKRESINIARVTKISAGLIGGAMIFGPLAMVAAPGFAAAIGSSGLLGAAGTGTAINTLSGAALTSSSLAAIGGGTMEAGAAVLTAAGAALGARAGAVISNSYFGEVDHFDIRTLKNGNKHAILFVNGFLSQGDNDTNEWEGHLKKHFPRNSWYQLDWESKNLHKLGAFIGGAPKAAGMDFAKEIAKRGLKQAPEKIGPLSMVSNIADLIGNPWHASLVKAAMTGVMLADAIARTPGWRFTLAGHSLGARVIYYALEALSTKQNKPIENVYLLGGAVGGSSKDKNGWKMAVKSVRGRIYNCYSIHDDVLCYLYRGANGFMSEPIGYSPIALKHPQIHNFDCQELVRSHMEWKSWFGEIIEQLNA